DGGTTWVSLPEPPPYSYYTDLGRPRRTVVVNPTNHDVVYATGRLPDPGGEGLFRTTDRGATWELVWPRVDANPDWRVLGAAISPANPEVKYLAAAGPYELALLRSPDARATWERARPVTNGDSSSLRRTMLVPHPTDASRLFRSDLSGGGTSTGNPLRQSRDQGATWADIWRNPSGAPRRMASPSALVGGQGAA